MLFTKWGEALDENSVLSEYPRPQFVRDSYFNLNGMWKCEFTKSAVVPEKFTNDILVPFSPECPLSKVNRVLENDEFLIYQKEFTLPEGFIKDKVFINFGAVDQIATVFLNGNNVGTHRGGYTPFSFEITDYLQENNVLNVVVSDQCEDNEYCRGKQRTKRGGIWYSKQSGIWQTVWIESTPKEYIEGVRIIPDYDNELVEFKFKGTNNVEILIYDSSVLIVQTTEKVIKLPNFKEWTPENPFLYQVEFRVNGESVKSYFAMRKFSVGTGDGLVKRFMLNNKPYFINGLLDQGYYPDGYLTPPSNEAMLNDIKFAKKCGFNMLRKHIKIEPLMWYFYCDVLGIIVVQDMINGGGIYGSETNVLPFIGVNLNDRNYKTFKRTNRESRRLFELELKEMIDHLYNCPCIAMWVPFNEGWGQFESSKAYKTIKNMDPTRLVDSASGWHDRGVSDVISKHTYFTPIKVKKGDKPYFLSEFGGLGLKIKGHTFNDNMFGYKIYNTQKSLTNAYTKLFNKTIIPQIPTGLAGTVYTQLTDVEDELNGLMTYDRKVEKIDTKVLKDINCKVKL